MPSILSNMGVTFQTGGRDIDVSAMVLMTIGLLIVAAPFDLGQLAFAFVGALCYAGLQASRKVTRSTLQKSDKIRQKKVDDDESNSAKPRVPKANLRGKSDASVRRKSDPILAIRASRRDENPAGKQEYRQASAQPVVAPTFTADTFDAQVQELVRQVAPSPEGDELVQGIAAAVKKALHKFIPEADVMGFASGDVLRGTAFAVAIPEVDIILNAHPSVFVERLQTRTARPVPHAAKLDPWKLQKSMLRACTDELTAVPGFKFRRSAFKGLEPKVTLMAELNGKTIPIDFSVNTITPLHNAALLTECGQIDPRAKELILFVRRWAKDRGISHAAKGHLSPYAWSLLVIYFLQVWDSEGEMLLPSLTSFRSSSGLLRKQQREQQSAGTQSMRSSMGVQESPVHGVSVASLFKEFIRFYTEVINWRNEAVSVRAGQRQPPAVALPLTIVTMPSGATDVAPSVEDPFAPKRNLSDSMTGVTLERFKEELVRAKEFCGQDAPLGKLIDPWVPPERDAAAPAGAGHDFE